MSLEGKPAPSLTLPAIGGDISIPSRAPMVVYFYPKDDTPGCTTEAKDFTDTTQQFSDLGVAIVGISPDTLAKHEKFIAKHDLSIQLASDEGQTAAGAFGVWVEKKMYGKTYMGVERSTFLIDADGVVAKEWRKVRVTGHVDEVLETVKAAFG
jgi:peroxiredoxin Q/BCP